MYKTLIKLPDGTFVSSGPNESIYIKDCKIRESVNSGHEMQLGSVCATEVTLSLGVVSAPLSITKGQTLEIYKVDDAGKRWNVGVFTAEQPTKTSAHTYKVTTYDHVLKLEKDIAAWLNSLTGWPYTLSHFAQMVCEACGVELRTTSFPNADFQVHQFTATSITGRQIMEWVGQLAARFVRAHYSGSIELAWYTKHIKTLQPTGSNYYLAGSLHYEDYNVEPIDAVQVRMAEQDHAFLWPEADPGANSYILKDNRLITQMNEAARECLATVLAELGRFTYRPCKVSIPATIHIHAGDILQVQTLDGQTFSTYVMTKTQTGNKDTLECTGSARRDDATAYDDNPKHSVVDIVGDALRGQTQQDIFNKLTNYGKAQGVFLRDNELYINATYIKSGKIISEGTAYLPPTYDDALLMLRSLTFPDRYPPEVFYDLNGDGTFDVEDVRLANNVYLGNASIQNCAGAIPTPVMVTIDPFNAEETVKIVGTNMWGSTITMSLGVNSSNIPQINGDCAVAGRFSVGGHAIVQQLACDIGETPKTLSWKDNGDGTFTLIGQ